jgi:tRNA threonylcarbamoyladenosine biosynthesis protein TsaB
LGKPVIGVTTLDVMAEEALLAQCLPFAVAAADAKRGEIYLGARSAKGHTLIAPELIAIEAVAARIERITETEGRSVALAGTAYDIVAPLLQAVGLDPVDSLVRQPDAIFVARLAMDAPPGQRPKPLYLREPDAKLPSAAS